MFETTLRAEDVPDDVTTFGIQGPWFAQVSADGQFRVEAQPPYAYYDEPVVLTLSDEDGGVESWPVQLWFYGGYGDTGGWYYGDSADDTGWNDVGDGAATDISCGGCCCWLAGFAPLLSFLPMLRRRLRP